MMRLIDRYILKELFSLFGMALLVLMLLMFLYQFLRLIEWVVDKGMSLALVLDLFIKLLPSFFLLTIPMATLFAVLIAFNRLSCDREGLALYACGISFFRLLLPVFLFSVFASGGTFLMGRLSSSVDRLSMKSVALRILKERLGAGLQAGQFTEILPGLIIYAASVPTPSEMRNIFIYDARSASHPRILVAHQGSFINENEWQGMQLHEGMARLDERLEDHQMRFGSYSLKINMARVAQEAAAPESLSPEEETDRLLAFHKRYALAFATGLFALLGVPLGLLSGTVGRMGLVLGMGLILLYHALTLAGEVLARSYPVAPFLAAWLANGILLPLTIVFVVAYAMAPRLGIRL